jgi:hypothetical protein
VRWVTIAKDEKKANDPQSVNRVRTRSSRPPPAGKPFPSSGKLPATQEAPSSAGRRPSRRPKPVTK